MKKLSNFICLLSTLAILTSCMATGTSNYRHNKTRFYSSDGKYQGYSIETPYKTRYYDSKSRYLGHSR